MAQRVIQTDEKLPLIKAIPLALQHLMAMFGATVLVPILTGLNPSTAIMMSGVGTIMYLIVTRNRIPSYLGSSFAFIGPILAVAGTSGLPAALGGIVIAGLVFMAVAAIVKAFGTAWIDRLFPPALVGAVIIVIGVGLAAVAINMAFQSGGDAFNAKGFTVAMITLAAAILASVFGRGFAKVIPILIGIIVGYVAGWAMGLIDFKPIAEAAWVGLPQVMFPEFKLGAILIIAPVAIVVVIEHIGHLLVLNEVVGKDFTPLLPQSLFGDGLATTLAGFFGGTPATTYAENIGVMAVTKVYATQIFWYAAAFAFLIGGFIPKVGAVISSIPVPVMGGISLLLFGLIASSGLRLMVSSKLDFSVNRNMILVAVVLILGIGMETSGITLPVGDYAIPGMALATFVGIVLNLILPHEKDEVNAES